MNEPNWERFWAFRETLAALEERLRADLYELTEIRTAPPWDEPYKVFERSTLDPSEFSALEPLLDRFESALETALERKRWSQEPGVAVVPSSDGNTGTAAKV